jgi:hypothetical protein
VQVEHQAFEDVGLDVGAREAVEEEPVDVRVAGDGVLDDLDDDFVADEAAGRDDALRFASELRAVRHLLAEKVAGRDVEQVVLLEEELGLRALAGAWRAEQRDVEHGRLPRRTRAPGEGRDHRDSDTDTENRG